MKESKSCSVVSDSLIPWTIACQAPLSIEFFRPKYWSGYLFPSPGDLPNLEIKPRSPALQAISLPAELQRKPKIWENNGQILGRGILHYTLPVHFKMIKIIRE